MEQPVAPAGRRQQQVGQGEGGQRQEALQHLGQKGGAHRDPDQSQPAPRRGRDGADQAVTGHGQHQHQQRVGVVEAEDQRRCGCARQRCACQQPGSRSRACVVERPPNRCVQHRHRRRTHQRLRRQHRPAVHAEQPHGQTGHPQRCRRLVDGDEIVRVERAEEPRRPTVRARLRRCGVEQIAVSRRRQIPHVQRRSRREQHGKHDLRAPVDGGGHGRSPCRALLFVGMSRRCEPAVSGVSATLCAMWNPDVYLTFADQRGQALLRSDCRGWLPRIRVGWSIWVAVQAISPSRLPSAGPTRRSRHGTARRRWSSPPGSAALTRRSAMSGPGNRSPTRTWW